MRGQSSNFREIGHFRSSRAYLKYLLGRGAAESWWGCSDSGSDYDSGLLIGSDSGSDSDFNSGPDAKYKINNTLIVERSSADQAKKKEM